MKSGSAECLLWLCHNVYFSIALGFFFLFSQYYFSFSSLYPLSTATINKRLLISFAIQTFSYDYSNVKKRRHHRHMSHFDFTIFRVYFSLRFFSFFSWFRRLFELQCVALAEKHIESKIKQKKNKQEKPRFQ